MKKNILWNAFGNIVYLFSQWLVTVLTARISGYEDAGVLSLAMSISATFQTVALFGIRNFQVSDIKGKYPDRSYIGLRNITCLTALALCLTFSLLNGYSSATVAAIMWFMLFRIAENYSDVLHGIFQRNDRLYIAGQSLFVKGIFVIVSFLSGYYIFGSLNGGLAAMAVSSAAETVFFDLYRARRLSELRLYDDFKRCLSLAKETVPLCMYMLLNSMIATAPKYILEKMSNEELLGAYSSIFAPALLIQAAAQYIYMPFISKFAILYQNKDIKGFLTLAARILLIIFLLGAALFAMSLVFGAWGLQLLFGESIEQYSGLLPLVIAAAFCTAINAFLQCLSVVIRDFKALVISCSAGFAVCCASSILLIGTMPADGASLGLIAGTVSGALYLAISILYILNRENKEEHK